MVERALPPTRASASRVTLASGVKPVCTGQARFIVEDNLVYEAYILINHTICRQASKIH